MAPRSPNRAPEAPTEMVFLMNRDESTLPPTPETRYMMPILTVRKRECRSRSDIVLLKPGGVKFLQLCIPYPNCCSSLSPMSTRLIMFARRWATPACSQMQVRSLHPWCSCTTLSHTSAPSFCSLRETRCSDQCEKPFIVHPSIQTISSCVYFGQSKFVLEWQTNQR